MLTWPSVCGLVVRQKNIMTESTWWSKTTLLIAARKQRERERGSGANYFSLRDTSAVILLPPIRLHCLKFSLPPNSPFSYKPISAIIHWQSESSWSSDLQDSTSAWAAPGIQEPKLSEDISDSNHSGRFLLHATMIILIDTIDMYHSIRWEKIFMCCTLSTFQSPTKYCLKHTVEEKDMGFE